MEKSIDHSIPAVNTDIMQHPILHIPENDEIRYAILSVGLCEREGSAEPVPTVMVAEHKPPFTEPQPVLYRLPEDSTFRNWVSDCIALAQSGIDVFPSEADFGQFAGVYYVDLVVEQSYYGDLPQVDFEKVVFMDTNITDVAVAPGVFLFETSHVLAKVILAAYMTPDMCSVLPVTEHAAKSSFDILNETLVAEDIGYDNYVYISLPENGEPEDGMWDEGEYAEVVAQVKAIMMAINERLDIQSMFIGCPAYEAQFIGPAAMHVLGDGTISREDENEYGPPAYTFFWNPKNTDIGERNPAKEVQHTVRVSNFPDTEADYEQMMKEFCMVCDLDTNPPPFEFKRFATGDVKNPTMLAIVAVNSDGILFGHELAESMDLMCEWTGTEETITALYAMLENTNISEMDEDSAYESGIRMVYATALRNPFGDRSNEELMAVVQAMLNYYSPTFLVIPKEEEAPFEACLKTICADDFESITKMDYEHECDGVMLVIYQMDNHDICSMWENPPLPEEED